MPSSPRRFSKKSVKPARPPAPPLALYRKIAVTFVVVVALILGTVIYVSTSRGIILVVPVEREVKTDFILDVVKTPTRNSQIRGRVLAVTAGKQKAFESQGAGLKEIPVQAKGQVVIKNTSSREQALVKTTRLLTPEGVLFHIDAALTVPAGGEATVGVYADQPGTAGDIAPSRFTIPGLSPSLQSVIYAESFESFTGGVVQVSVLTQEELDQSYEILKSELLEDAKKALREETGGVFGGEMFDARVKEQSSDVKVGEEARGFTLSMTAELAGVFYDQTALDELSQWYLYDQLEKGFSYRTPKPEVTVAVEKYDVEAGVATLRVSVRGVAVPSLAHPDLSPFKFSGMSREQVKEYFLGRNLAQEVDVRLSPFWSRSVPRLGDHIYLEIK